MGFGNALKRTGRVLLSTDDGTLMRHAFTAVLSVAAILVVVDYRDLVLDGQHPGLATPGTDPALPVLPPSLTDGKPEGAPGDIKTAQETLRAPIRFDLKPGGILTAEGTVDAGSADRFRAEIEARGEYVKTVQLSSPGGSVADALAISALIREKGLSTDVKAGALCASSCPLILAGGVTRSVEDGAIIGVHQIYDGSGQQARAPTGAEAMAMTQVTTARIGRHLQQMGVKPDLWLLGLETPPDSLHYLTAKEMADTALVTAPVKRKS
ncbi:hypothetical protein SAMN05880582_101646 [Rhizobium sp. RU20A]|uniref:COG3904 family protein n=1 Tax=Rhizobium sp. RU20A TaxID=1907412 RepID=UPI000954F1F9|nr:hypothetical protein [Rhizobium sp. RU20A]SIQ07925.1 hypothetical protein SAMN05880582_101646 [Rhizobium sp. RU20A]